MIEATIVVDGRRHEVHLTQEDGTWTADVDGHRFPIKSHRQGTQAAVDAGGYTHIIDLADAHMAIIDGNPVPFSIEALKGVAGAQAAETGGHGPIKPPMTGRLEQVLVQEGDTVERGDVLFVLEAMKMRNEVKSPASGVIGPVRAQPGDAVETGTVVLELLAPE